MDGVLFQHIVMDGVLFQHRHHLPFSLQLPSKQADYELLSLTSYGSNVTALQLSVKKQK
jgi:hypothetical protein